MAHIALISAAPTGTAEVKVAAAIAQLGHTVSSINQTAIATTDFDPFDAIVALLVDNSQTRADQLTALWQSKPVLLGQDPSVTTQTNYSSLVTKMGLAGNVVRRGASSGNAEIVVLPVQHPITAGFAPGRVQVTPAGDWNATLVSAADPATGVRLADGDPDDSNVAGRSALIAFDGGTHTSAHRFVWWGTLYGGQGFTADGLKLLDNTLAWLTHATMPYGGLVTSFAGPALDLPSGWYLWTGGTPEYTVADGLHATVKHRPTSDDGVAITCIASLAESYQYIRSTAAPAGGAEAARFGWLLRKGPEDWSQHLNVVVTAHWSGFERHIHVVENGDWDGPGHHTFDDSTRVENDGTGVVGWWCEDGVFSVRRWRGGDVWDTVWSMPAPAWMLTSDTTCSIEIDQWDPAGAAGSVTLHGINAPLPTPLRLAGRQWFTAPSSLVTGTALPGIWHVPESQTTEPDGSGLVLPEWLESRYGFFRGRYARLFWSQSSAHVGGGIWTRSWGHFIWWEFAYNGDESRWEIYLYSNDLDPDWEIFETIPLAGPPAGVRHIHVDDEILTQFLVADEWVTVWTETAHPELLANAAFGVGEYSLSQPTLLTGYNIEPHHDPASISTLRQVTISNRGQAHVSAHRLVVITRGGNLRTASMLRQVAVVPEAPAITRTWKTGTGQIGLQIHTGSTERVQIYAALSTAGMTTANYASVGTLIHDGQFTDWNAKWFTHSGLKPGDTWCYIVVGPWAYDQSVVLKGNIACETVGRLVDCDAVAAGQQYGNPMMAFESSRFLSSLNPGCSVFVHPASCAVQWSHPEGFITLGCPMPNQRVKSFLSLDPNCTGWIAFYPKYGQELGEWGFCTHTAPAPNGNLFGICAHIHTGYFTPGLPPHQQRVVVFSLRNGIRSQLGAYDIPDLLQPWWGYSYAGYVPVHGSGLTLELDVRRRQDLDVTPPGALRQEAYHVSLWCEGVLYHDQVHHFTVHQALNYEHAFPPEGVAGLRHQGFGGGVHYHALEISGTDLASVEVFEREDGSIGWDLPPGTPVDVHVEQNGQWVYHSTVEGGVDLPFAFGDSDAQGSHLAEGARLLLGSGDGLYHADRGTKDAAAHIRPRIRTAELAPAGVGGEAEFSDVYVTSRNQNAAGYTMTPVVDGKLLAQHAVVLPGGDGPLVRVRELPLYQHGDGFSYLPRGPYIALLFEALRIKLSAACLELILQAPFPEMYGAEVDREIIREAFPSIAFDPEPWAEGGLHGATQLLIGAGDGLMVADHGIDDDGEPFPVRIGTDDILPAGEGGECEFTRLYLAITRANPEPMTVLVTRALDGVQAGEQIELELDGTEEPITEVHEIELMLEAEGHSYSMIGQAFALRVDLTDVPAGISIFHGAELEFEVKRESMRAHDG